MRRAYERLLEYVKIYTRSDEKSETIPSTERQFSLARILKEELVNLGLQDVKLSDTCCVYAKLPATSGLESLPCLGFLAHMDTADYEAEHVQPRILPDYDGDDVELGNGKTLRVADFPHLPSLRGKTLIVTDGSTLLGADDKAGIAEILTLCERLIREGLPHGPIAVAFTPDEEVGRGTEGFDPALFGAVWAYTVDGGAVNAVEYETFNACGARMTFEGFNVHPGSAKNVMRNAALMAMEANSMLPAGDTPAHTCGREGFFHLVHMEGDVEKAELDYILRDHEAARFQARKDTLQHVTELLCEKYGQGAVSLEIRDQYRNMAEKILPCMHLVENAKAAVAELGLTPETPPIRGGTDGSALSYMGIPCPNLGTGGWAYHGPYEHIAAEDMDLAVELLLGIVRRYAVTQV